MLRIIAAAFLGLLVVTAEEKPDEPWVAEHFVCWEAGVVQVMGGWTRDESGSWWLYSVSETIESGEGKLRGRYRMLTDLDLATYQRLRRMDDADFLKEFAKLHEARGGIDYNFWNEIRDGALLYRDNDQEETDYHKFDVEIPQNLTPGGNHNAFGMNFSVAAQEKAMKGFWGECKAVKIVALFEAEVVDGEEYPPYRVEQWYGEGLSSVLERTVVLKDKEDAEGDLMSELRLQRMIRPAVDAPQE